MAESKFSEEEVVADHSRRLHREKRIKFVKYCVVFIVFQTAIILLFALTVMKVRRPKFRVRSATFGNFDVVTSTSNPSFNINMIAELGVKNTNFGRYKYDDSTISFYYGTTQVGTSYVPNGRAKARSTKKFSVIVDLSSATLPSDPRLGQYLSYGILPLTAQSGLRGKVKVMNIFNKRKTANMLCTMDLNLAIRTLQNIQCK
ncbi:late embryogenesis abundant protein At1g64065-like [Cornus florida]|uniref:late embryogenesis abundant protein At1g64065-like n=1 Tax=Cornus florida TaxID=4283 RepID=UPI00289FDFA8|nr:late embryogenesis abundant protein At1g64065-like [Cornus florida]